MLPLSPPKHFIVDKSALNLDEEAGWAASQPSFLLGRSLLQPHGSWAPDLHHRLGRLDRWGCLDLKPWPLRKFWSCWCCVWWKLLPCLSLNTALTKFDLVFLYVSGIISKQFATYASWHRFHNYLQTEQVQISLLVANQADMWRPLK